MFFLFLACTAQLFELSAPARGVVSAALSPAALAECYFRQPYAGQHHRFRLPSTTPLRFRHQTFGQFSAFSKGLLYFSPTLRCLEGLRIIEVKEVPPIFHHRLANFFDSIAGPSLLLDPDLARTELKHPSATSYAPYACELTNYNPKAIEWLAEWVPQPTDKIGSITMQQVYDSSFSRVVRMMTESRLWLHQQDLVYEQSSYCQQVAADSYSKELDPKQRPQLPGYLRHRYQKVLPAYGDGIKHTDFGPPLAVGFWIRRSLDGTDTAFWNNLIYVLERFDGTWLDQQRQLDARYQRL